MTIKGISEAKADRIISEGIYPPPDDNAHIQPPNSFQWASQQPQNSISVDPNSYV